MASSFVRQTPYSADNSKLHRLNSLLVELICAEGLPLRLVESEAFQAFVRELDPRYKLPTRQALSSKLIPDKYDTISSEVKDEISKADTVSITTDMWTSSANQSYMGLTAHWLDDRFKMYSRCLAVRPAPGSHTADFISKELTSLAGEWNLELVRLHAITDSGANVKKSMTQQLPVQKWRPCFAHTLQLCVNGALANRSVSELPKIIQKARNIVSHFQRSPLASAELLKAQKQLNIPQHKLLQDCPTRWNLQVAYVNVFTRFKPFIL